MSGVTVIMPAYNAAPFLDAAISSVVGQTYRNWTLKIVDDGSSDQTFALAADWARRDPRIHAVTGPNRGIANVMNTAVAESRTEWIACMHADDIMLPCRLERQLAFSVEHPDVSVFSSLVEWIDAQGRSLGRNRSDLTTPEGVRRKLATGGCVAFPHPVVMFRRSVVLAVGGYKQAFFPAEDTELWNRICFAGHGVLVQPEILLQYRQHASSASMSRAATMVAKLRWMESCIDAWRVGRSEPTFEQFWSARRSAGLFRRLQEGRKDQSRVLYQAAIGRYAARRHASAIAMLGLAALLEPELVLARLGRRAATLVRQIVPSLLIRHHGATTQARSTTSAP